MASDKKKDDSSDEDEEEDFEDVDLGMRFFSLNWIGNYILVKK